MLSEESVSRRPSSALLGTAGLLDNMRMENLLLDLNNVKIDNLEGSFGGMWGEILIGLDSRENEKEETENSLLIKISTSFPLKESRLTSRKM